jgi:energy-coupling factor transporter ATP-binding protein EcfA2
MLKALTYAEYRGMPQEWILERCDFSQINLVVGKNATGKTRLLNVVNGLCRLLSGQQTTPYQSGRYVAEIELEGKVYELVLEFTEGKIAQETLKVDDVVRLQRGLDGKGSIYYEQKDLYIDFQLDQTSIAIQQRRDELQHSFVVKLANWAMGAQVYLFGSSLGRENLMVLGSVQSALKGVEKESSDLIRSYTRSFEKYKNDFDLAIITDMNALGYDLVDVGTDDMRGGAGINVPEPLIGMFVEERDRPIRVSQLQMSQGMFRALAMVVHINVASFERRRTLVLVDDIGEGLDFERSTCLIDVLIRHAKETGLQVVMTTNDRFVMNRVPLEHWSLLRRNGSTVKAFTERNSPKEFADFRYIGLNNFEFFTSATLH